MEKSMKRNRMPAVFAGIFLAVLCMLPLRVHAAGVLDKYPEGKVYDVTAYGADKTGQTLSDKGFLKASSAIYQDIRKGNLEGRRPILYFPGGTYKTGKPIRINAGVAVAAEADTTVIFSGSEGSRGLEIRGSEASADIAIEGGTWQGSGKEVLIYANYARGLKISNVNVKSGRMGIGLYNTTASLENVTVTGCTGMGMTLTMASKVNAADLRIVSNGNGYPKAGLGHGIGVYGKTKLTITDSLINKNRECGISVQLATISVNKCRMQNNGRHAVGTSKVCSVTMNGCDIYRNGRRDKMDGVILVDGSKGKFTNCTFRSNAVFGLMVNHGGTSAVVKGCTFKDNGVHNIYIENMGRGKVKTVIDSCKFYKCKKTYSVIVYAKKKAAYSLSIKGKNKYYKVKPKYAYVINHKLTCK